MGMSIPEGWWKTLLWVCQMNFPISLRETPCSAKPHMWVCPQVYPVTQQQQKAAVTSCSPGTGRAKAVGAAWWVCCLLLQGSAWGLGEQAGRWLLGQLEASGNRNKQDFGARHLLGAHPAAVGRGAVLLPQLQCGATLVPSLLQALQV